MTKTEWIKRALRRGTQSVGWIVNLPDNPMSYRETLRTLRVLAADGEIVRTTEGGWPAYRLP